MDRLMSRCVHVSAFAAALLALALAGGGTLAASPSPTPHAATPVTDPSAPWYIPPQCPVTLPNGSTPPDEKPNSNHYGNGKEWTKLPSDGVALFTPNDVEPDGSLATKWWWWAAPGIVGPPTFEGRRLDAPAPPLRATIPAGYISGFFPVALYFPIEGCWEVTGLAGGASLTFVVLVLRTPAAPVPGTPPPFP